MSRSSLGGSLKTTQDRSSAVTGRVQVGIGEARSQRQALLRLLRAVCADRAQHAMAINTVHSRLQHRRVRSQACAGALSAPSAPGYSDFSPFLKVFFENYGQSDQYGEHVVPLAQKLIVTNRTERSSPVHGRANRSGWDFQVSQLQNQV